MRTILPMSGRSRTREYTEVVVGGVV